MYNEPLMIPLLVDTTDKEEFILPYDSKHCFDNIKLIGNPNPCFKLILNGNNIVHITNSLNHPLHTLIIEESKIINTDVSLYGEFKNIHFDTVMSSLSLYNSKCDFLYLSEDVKQIRCLQSIITTMMYKRIEVIAGGGDANIQHFAGTTIIPKFHGRKLCKFKDINQDANLYNTHFKDIESGIVYGKYLIGKNGMVDLTENVKYMDSPQFNVSLEDFNGLMIGEV